MKGLRTLVIFAYVTILASLALPYGVSASGTRGVVDRVFFDSFGGSYGSGPVGRDLGVWFVNFGGPSFTVDTRRLTVVLTCTHFCQGGVSRELDARHSGVVRSAMHGRDAVAVAELPLPDDLPWGMYRARVVDARGGVRSTTGVRQKIGFIDNAFVSIPPVADPATGYDEHLRDARLAYVGRTVQGFGSLRLDCDDPLTAQKDRALEAYGRRFDAAMSPSQRQKLLFAMPAGPALVADVGNEPSLVVTSIDRPVGPSRSWRIGGDVSTRGAGDDRFVAVSPLRVSFANAAGKACVNPRLWVADDWELRRTLWVHAPLGVPETTTIRKHMTRETVAHILGFPGEYGSVDDMNRLNEWRYVESGPFSSTVYFRNDRVSDYHPAGMPP